MTFEPMDHEMPAADLEALRAIAEGHGKGGIAVEVGTWAGASALVLADSFNFVYCVDHWEGNRTDRLAIVARKWPPGRAFRGFCRNMGDRLFQDVFPCRGESTLWAAVWTRPIDLLFIDGDHRYESVVDDIESWRRHVRPGGVVAFHDYGIFPGVTKAVDEYYPHHRRDGASIAFALAPGLLR